MVATTHSPGDRSRQRRNIAAFNPSSAKASTRSSQSTSRTGGPSRDMTSRSWSAFLSPFDACGARTTRVVGPPEATSYAARVTPLAGAPMQHETSRAQTFPRYSVPVATNVGRQTLACPRITIGERGLRHSQDVRVNLIYSRRRPHPQAVLRLAQPLGLRRLPSLPRLLFCLPLLSAADVQLVDFRGRGRRPDEERRGHADSDSSLQHPQHRLHSGHGNNAKNQDGGARQRTNPRQPP